jgi:hypothetical protein
VDDQEPIGEGIELKMSNINISAIVAHAAHSRNLAITPGKSLVGKQFKTQNLIGNGLTSLHWPD